MRILISALRFRPGHTYGAEVYFSAVLRALSEVLDFPHRIALAASITTSDWANGVAPDVETLRFKPPRSGSGALLYEWLNIQHIARRWRADLVFFPFNTMPPLRTPGVLMLHDLVSRLYLEQFPDYNRIHNQILWWSIRRSVHHARVVVTPSRAIATEVTDVLGKREVQAIHEAPVARGGSILQPPLGDRKRTNVLLLTGAKLPHKSQHTAVDAMSVLRRTHPQLFSRTLLVVTGGTAAELQPLRAQVAALDLVQQVEFAGKVSEAELEGWSSLATLHLFPTLYEGFGLGVVEAQSRGKAVVASAIPVLKEVSGGIGAFFRPGDAHDMADQIAQLLLDDPWRCSLERAGSAHVAKWSWRDHAEQLVAVFVGASGT